jgi:tol-pal system protein YbgF
MSILKASVATALLAGVLLSSAGEASAQLFNRPPGAVQGGDPHQGGVNDPAALMLRIERLENQIRSLTGQLEEAQFQNRRLDEQVRRLQEAGAGAVDQPPLRGGPTPQRRTDALDAPGAGAPPPRASAGRGRGDAFDPTQAPGAPGAPRVLGAIDQRGGLAGPLGDPIIEDGPYEVDPSAPLDLLNPRRPPARPVPSALPAPPQSAPLPALPEPARQPPRTQTAMPVDPAPNAPASTLPPPGPRETLDAANAAMRSGDLERAETGYRDFLNRYPTSRLASEATFNLGDVFARRGRHREAAEQFLKVTTDFSKSTQAAPSLHRLGQSLERLGAKEQACAAWAEVPRKYPTAPQTIRAAAERDIKRASC